LFYEVIDRGITQEPGNTRLGQKSQELGQMFGHRRRSTGGATSERRQGYKGKQAQNGKNQKPARDEKGSKPLLPHAFLDVS
jgi:hypothetical protein